jgi:hypothetical protein
MLAKMVVKWKNVIRRRREADERKKQRDKELKIQEEMKRLEMMNSMAYKIMGEKALGDGGEGGTSNENKESEVQQLTRIMRNRMERIRLEDLIRREDLDATEGQQRRDKIQQHIDEIKESMGKRLTRADILNITRSIEMKLLMDEKIVQRNKLQKELQEKKEETEERNGFIEEVCEEKEVQMTTPRSLCRRKLIRRTHMAMKRQKESLIICEWGCGDWFHVGYEQQDHQLRRCVKRILPCSLGCEVKNTEEYWLATHIDPPKAVPSSTSSYGGGGVGAGVAAPVSSSSSIASASFGGGVDGGGSYSPNTSQGSPSSSASYSPTNSPSNSVSKRKSMKSRQSIREINQSRQRTGGSIEDNEGKGKKKGNHRKTMKSSLSKESLEKMLINENTEKKLLGTISNQQYHETHECSKRLVICPLQCLEWISIEFLPQHMKELCTKRPAKPLICRLGCSLEFGGKIENLISAEDDRIQHEQEECEYRIVRCNWCYDDGRVCAAQMKANERSEHRDYHLNLLGIINYRVPGM